MEMMDEGVKIVRKVEGIEMGIIKEGESLEVI